MRTAPPPPPLPPLSGEGEGRERAGVSRQARPSSRPRLLRRADPLPTLSLSLRGGEEARKSAIGAAALLTLVACSKPAEAPVVYLGLDCARPFEAQAAALTTQQHLVPAPEDPAEPYRFYSSADGRTSYLITKAGAPGHPAIMMQKAQGSDVITTGCPYGNKKGYDQLHAYLDGLKHWTRGK